MLENASIGDTVGDTVKKDVYRETGIESVVMIKEKPLHKSSITQRAAEFIISLNNAGLEHLKIDDIAEALKINKKFSI